MKSISCVRRGVKVVEAGSPKSLYISLYKLGHDVKLCPKSIENGEVFELSLSEKRLLITRDKHFVYNPYSLSKHLGVCY